MLWGPMDRPVRSVATPALVGAVYLLALAAWAARSPPAAGADGDAQMRALEGLVRTHFGADIARMAIAVGAAAVALGALLGVVAWSLVAARDALAGHPMRRGVARQALLALAVVASVHAALELRGMAAHPALYAGAFYARGGVRRTVQVLATDVLGPSGVLALGLLAALAFVLGSPRRWPLHARGLARWVRNHRAHLAPATLGLGAVASLRGLPPVLAADPRPNLLILAADSLRADSLAPRTAPHLDALAAQGARFDHAYVSLPRTFPSWVTLLTGRYAHHHGIRSMFPRWEERARDFDALPGRLARAGYATAVVSDYAGDVFSRIDLGFGAVDVPTFDVRQLVGQRVLERETPLLPLLHSRAGRRAFPVTREWNDAAEPAMLAADAVRMLRRLEGSGPFALVVFFSTVHLPYAAPAPYSGRFTDAAYRGRYKYDRPVGLGGDAPADARDQAQVRGLYAGAVSAVDDAAQTVLDAVRHDGLADRTVVVLTADHGETLYDHGHGLGHGDHLFGDEGTHVPLVIVDPRHPGGRHEPGVVRDVDLAPTLYALAGVTPPSDLDGASLAPALDGRPLPPREAFAESALWFTEDVPGLPSDLRLPYPGIERLTEIDTRHGDEIVLRDDVRALTRVARHRMVRDARWKLVYVPTRTGVRWMLFDTQEDPGETRDVAAAHADVVSRLQESLWSWMLSDPEMSDRGGYLVPRTSAAEAGTDDAGLVRLGDDGAPP